METRTDKKRKKSRRSIAFAILRPLICVVVALIIVITFAYGYINDGIETLEASITQGNFKALTQGLSNNTNAAKRSVSLINEDFDTFYDAEALGDEEGMNNELDWVRRSCDGLGYIFADEYGDVVVSTYENVDVASLGSVVEMAKAAEEKEDGNHVINGTGSFVGGRMIDYVAVAVRNQEERLLGVLIVVCNYLDDKDLFEEYRRVLSVESYIFQGQKCVMTTDTLIKDINSFAPDAEAVSFMLAEKAEWQGVSYMTGEKEYMAAFPIVNAEGENMGFAFFRPETAKEKEIISVVAFICLFSAFLLIAYVIFMMFELKNSLLKPINHLIDDISYIGKGDMTHDVTVERTCSEMDKLADGVDLMKEEIREVIRPVKETSDFILNSSKQLACAAESLSNASNRQAASLEEISSAMEEIGANIQQNTENSVQANHLAADVNTKAGELGTVTENSYKVIKNISENINDINHLVSQTNILSLNASVEAARAGRFGLGFGVVAKEVGRLAEQTRGTAQSIGKTATDSIAEAQEAYNGISALIPKIDQITNLVREITTSSIEQNSGAGQINTAIADLNRVTQGNAASAEEIAASTQNLQGMVEDLNKCVARFKV